MTQTLPILPSTHGESSANPLYHPLIPLIQNPNPKPYTTNQNPRPSTLAAAAADSALASMWRMSCTSALSAAASTSDNIRPGASRSSRPDYISCPTRLHAAVVAPGPPSASAVPPPLLPLPLPPRLLFPPLPPSLRALLASPRNAFSCLVVRQLTALLRASSESAMTVQRDDGG